MNKRNHAERIEPTVDSMPTMEEGLTRLVEKEVDNLRTLSAVELELGKPDRPGPRYEFVKLAGSLAESIVEAAQIQFTKAQNNLERAKAFADELKTKIEAKDRELSDIEDRLTTFGETVLEAHERFHSGDVLVPAKAEKSLAEK